MMGRGSMIGALCAIALVVASYAVTADAVEGSTQGQSLKRDGGRAPVELLSRADQHYIQREYADARDLFMVGRYYQARLKIVGIYQMVPYYEDSEDLLRMIDAALAKKK